MFDRVPNTPDYYLPLQGVGEKGNTDALLTRFCYTKKLVKIYLQSITIAYNCTIYHFSRRATQEKN